MSSQGIVIAGNSDPIFLFDENIDQRLKGTLGITG